ncbi:hypothetical protein [Streptomyces sp. RKAG337]|uniref:hypothetical protein n=1 Tax=Streptomyces sp. RKAG337 TaxID=2893404 RepID=UPI0020346F23|nr:hypothetical protein [Streptomyces sp. RKAG337]MCM2431084.1 hypothetical protein [Streptomyces sp. RKAG337]
MGMLAEGGSDTRVELAGRQVVDQFRAWKSYARAAESALFRAGYNDLEYAVRRTDAAGAAEARWAWNCASADLTGEEWPDGLVLVWSSSAGWGYQARPSDSAVALPVPVLAAPEAIVALLPALMDGRRGQLPASESRWEHAEAITSWLEAASVLGDDKYDAAYQREEEAAATFLRWQDELDGKATNDPSHAETPADRQESGFAPQKGRNRGRAVVLDPDGAPLPPAEEATLGLVVGMLAVCAELAGEMSRQPHSPTIHADVLLAQYSRVANVAQWVGLAATALRRDLLEHVGRAPAAARAHRTGIAELARYRIVAQRTDNAHPGAATLTNYTYARSVEEAVATVRAENERPEGLYGTSGLYQIVEVSEEEPDVSEARHEEVARRRFLTSIMNAAYADTHGGLRPHPDLFGVLTDYFTRAIVFPGQLAQDDGQAHTSDPSRALAHLLLEHLKRHGFDLEAAPEVDGYDASPHLDAGPHLVDRIAQALQDSGWFASAEPGKGPAANDMVTLTTLYGTRYVLHVTIPSDSTSSSA